jgi:hypothetical protein
MFFVPVGAFARVQPTVLLMLAVVWLVTRQATRGAGGDGATRHPIHAVQT